jgi:hypothetical protein
MSTSGSTKQEPEIPESKPRLNLSTEIQFGFWTEEISSHVAHVDF